jgi:hypothetical protein
LASGVWRYLFFKCFELPAKRRVKLLWNFFGLALL